MCVLCKVVSRTCFSIPRARLTRSLPKKDALFFHLSVPILSHMAINTHRRLRTCSVFYAHATVSLLFFPGQQVTSLSEPVSAPVLPSAAAESGNGAAASSAAGVHRLAHGGSLGSFSLLTIPSMSPSVWVSTVTRILPSPSTSPLSLLSDSLLNETPSFLEVSHPPGLLAVSGADRFESLPLLAFPSPLRVSRLPILAPGVLASTSPSAPLSLSPGLPNGTPSFPEAIQPLGAAAAAAELGFTASATVGPVAPIGRPGFRHPAPDVAAVSHEGPPPSLVAVARFEASIVGLLSTPVVTEDVGFPVAACVNQSNPPLFLLRRPFSNVSSTAASSMVFCVEGRGDCVYRRGVKLSLKLLSCEPQRMFVMFDGYQSSLSNAIETSVTHWTKMIYARLNRSMQITTTAISITTSTTPVTLRGSLPKVSYIFRDPARSSSDPIG